MGVMKLTAGDQQDHDMHLHTAQHDLAQHGMAQHSTAYLAQRGKT